jgi:hypothetical protein
VGLLAHMTEGGTKRIRCDDCREIKPAHWECWTCNTQRCKECNSWFEEHMWTSCLRRPCQEKNRVEPFIS